MILAIENLNGHETFGQKNLNAEHNYTTNNIVCSNDKHNFPSTLISFSGIFYLRNK